MAEDDSYKKIKPAEKHFPVTKQEVDSWYDRIEEVTSSIEEFLREDPVEAAERKAKREREREAARAKQEKDRLVQRYDPRYYVRFESDELINKMLQEVENPPPPPPKFDKAHLSTFESVTLKEAENMKTEGNAAFKKGDLQEAHHKYSLGIAMEVVDPDLVTALRNNRAQVNILLKNWVEAADDASAVLLRERHNVKALLRRATALSELHRPVEALADVEAILRAEPKNVDGLRLRESVSREIEDYKECMSYEQRVPEDVRRIQDGIAKLEAARGKVSAVVAVETRPDGTLRLAADKDVENAMNLVVAAASELLQLFVERASATCFRFRGGFAALLPLVRLMMSEVDKKVLSSSVSAKVALVAVFRLLASSLATDLNVERCGSLTDVVEYCADGATELLAAGANDQTKAVLLLKSAACINVLEAAARTEAYCTAIVAKLPKASLERLTSGTVAKNPLMQPSLKLYAALMGKGGKAAAERYAGLDICAPSLASLASPSPALQEAAVLALLRVAAQPGAIEALGSKEALRAVASCAVAISDRTSTSISPVVQEGLYSILYNVAVQTTDRLPLASVLTDSRHNVFDIAVRSLAHVANGGPDATRWMNVAARHLALLAKFVGVSSDVASLLVEVEDTVLWRMVQSQAAEAATRVKDAVTTVASHNESAVSYPDQCVEHATLCLAHLLRGKLVPVETLTDRQHIDLLLSLLSVPNPITVGNAAIILSMTPPAAGLEVLEAANGVKVMLAAILRLRGDCHAMESSGLHTTANSIYTNMKAAQKNVAVALAKCTARPSMLEQLREQNGIEILSTTM